MLQSIFTEYMLLMHVILGLDTVNSSIWITIRMDSGLEFSPKNNEKTQNLPTNLSLVKRYWSGYEPKTLRAEYFQVFNLHLYCVLP